MRKIPISETIIGRKYHDPVSCDERLAISPCVTLQSAFEGRKRHDGVPYCTTKMFLTADNIISVYGKNQFLLDPSE